MFSYWSDAKGLPAGFWNRVSDERQVEAESPDVHRSRGKAFCEDLGLPLVAIYELPGVSGESVLSHPEGRRMWADVAAGKIKALVFSSLARVGRDLLELLKIEKHLTKYGCRLISIRERIDTSTPDGMDYFVMIGNRAQTERLELSARVRAGLKQRARMGQITATRTPYGYRKVDRKMEIHPTESIVRQLMYQLYPQLMTMSGVTKELNARGYRNRNGKLWDQKQVRRVLLDTSAMGIYFANRTSGKGGFKPEDDWIAIEVPAIISPEEWKHVQNLIKGRTKRARRQIYPYSGLLHCHCGSKMHVRANLNHQTQRERRPPRYECRACGNKIHMQDLETGIASLFKGLLLDGVNESELEVSQAEQQLKMLQGEIKTIRQSKQRWASAFAAGALDLTEFTTYHQPLVEQERALAAEIDRLEAEQQTSEEQRETQEQYARALHSIAWGELEPLEKQGILREFVHTITLSPTKIHLQLLFTPVLLLMESSTSAPRLHTRAIFRPDVGEEPAGRLAWGYHLRRARKARGESRAQVAAALGIDPTLHSRLELQTYLPGPELICRVVDYLGFVPWSRTPYAQATAGEAFRALRDIKGLKQIELGNAIDVSQAALSAMERGETNLRRGYERLETLLNIEVRRVHAAYKSCYRVQHHPQAQPKAS